MEKKKTQISLTLAENESVIRTWCENCDDIQIRPMKLGKTGGTGSGTPAHDSAFQKQSCPICPSHHPHS